MSASDHHALLAGLAANRGLLVLGPAFGAGVPVIEPQALLEGLRGQLPEGPTWEGLRPADRLELLATAMGADMLARALSEALPCAEALRGDVGAFHARLFALPFRVVVLTGLDDLGEATQAVVGGPWRVVCRDADLDAPRLPGERLLIKVRDDLRLGAPRLGRDALRRMSRTNPRLVACLRAEHGAGGALLYGFGPRSEALRFVFDDLLDAPAGGCHVILRSGSGLWRAWWEARGTVVTASATVGELEAAVGQLGEALAQARPRISAESGAALVRLDAEARRATARQLDGLPGLAWAGLPRGALDALDEAVVPTVLDGLALLEAVAERGLRPPALPAARAAELLSRLGHAEPAWRALRLAVPALESDASEALGSVGRALSRLGEEDRARPYLERALEAGDPADRWARASDLAWLAKSVLDRIDRMRAAHRKRAVTEIIAAFLRSQADRLVLGRLDPGDDEHHTWSVYYINLRLGRVMALASEMAQASGRVYAEQAIALLTRAIELVPQKPDPYKAVRPLLSDRRFGVADARRWMALVAGAPPDVQRKLAQPVR